jgi:membrane fusion protein, copper/silver efflux system
MRSNCIVNISVWTVVLLLAASCGERAAKQSHHPHTTHDSSVASMVRPVNEVVLSGMSTIKPESGTRIFSVEIDGTVSYDPRSKKSLSSRVAGRIERLYIKYNYQPVRKGQLIMEIYSPDLAAAQRDLLYLVEHPDAVMIDKAKQRLKILGMRDKDISDIIYEKEILYRIPVYSEHEGYIAEETSTSAELFMREGQYVTKGQQLFTVYDANAVIIEFALDKRMAGFVSKGMNILLHRINDRSDMQSATIGLIEPVYRNGQSFSVARVYARGSDFRIGELLRANVPVVIKSGWWLPKSAVWRTGTKAIVFENEGGSFKPREVETGVEMKEAIQVLTDIEGWNIAPNASYLVDSESFINANDQNN